MNPSLHDHKYQRSLADPGAFIEYDMIGMDYFYADQQGAVAVRRGERDRHLQAGRGRLSRLDSHVAGRVLENDARALRRVGYGYILKHFVPRLKRHGMDQRTIDHMLIENPRRVFSAEHRAR